MTEVKEKEEEEEEEEKEGHEMIRGEPTTTTTEGVNMMEIKV